MHELPVLQLTLDKISSQDEVGLLTILATLRKVSGLLENGRRLENLSERLWYKQELADKEDVTLSNCVDPAKSPRLQDSTSSEKPYASRRQPQIADSSIQQPLQNTGKRKPSLSVKTEPPPAATVAQRTPSERQEKCPGDEALAGAPFAARHHHSALNVKPASPASIRSGSPGKRSNMTASRLQSVITAILPMNLTSPTPRQLPSSQESLPDHATRPDGESEQILHSAGEVCSFSEFEMTSSADCMTVRAATLKPDRSRSTCCGRKIAFSATMESHFR